MRKGTAINVNHNMRVVKIPAWKRLFESLNYPFNI